MRFCERCPCSRIKAWVEKGKRSYTRLHIRPLSSAVMMDSWKPACNVQQRSSDACTFVQKWIEVWIDDRLYLNNHIMEHEH